ncbi:zinc finger MYM-type protein 4-like isoform X2 [Echeneis naucrates]|uniref:zinc finger MYM-type protein 4-like isoform X2 n=1 Tax=Echeneis naucrates TaxID=173247 RepID=UPI00111339BF|nr:zinc finger MYM-type protein 4-like isoform X2 [Echeneis naucrates]
MPRKGKRSEAQKLRWEKHRAEQPTQQMVSEEILKPSVGTGFCHRPQRWPKSCLTGLSYKLVIPPDSPGKKFVLIIGDTQLRAIVDGFIQMPEGHLSFGIMTAPKASTSELQTEVVHSVLPRTPEAVCLLAPSNTLTSSKTTDEIVVDFAELLSTICRRWPKVFVVDFPPRLNIEASYQDLVRQAFLRVAAGMGVKYFPLAEYFPLTRLELWGKDGVHLSDCEGMRIFVRLLWSASVQQLETQPPTAKVPPTPLPLSRTLSPLLIVRDGVSSPPSTDPFECKPVGQGSKMSQLGEPSESQASAQIRIAQQQDPQEEECFSPLNPVWFSSTALRAMEEASPPHKSGLADFKPSPKRKKTSQPGELFQSQSSFQARMAWRQVPQEEECFSPLNPVWFSSTALRAMEEASSHMSGLVDFEPSPKCKKTVSNAPAKEPLTKAKHPPTSQSPVNNKVKSHQMVDMIENVNKEGDSDSCRNRCMVLHKVQPSTAAERKSPSSEESNVTEEKPLLPKLESIKEERIDEDYHQSLQPSITAECIKHEPSLAQEDLKIGSVFSLTEDSPSAAPTVALMDLPASCSKVITQSQQGLQAQVDTDRTMKDFCSQTCVSTFNYKKITATKIPIMPLTPHSQCSVCSRSCISKHEIVRQDVVHKFCSEPCVLRFCNMNNLTLCANCHSCSNTLLILKMEEGDQKLCSAECLAQFKKQKIQTPQPCAMCQTSSSISDMVEHRKSEDVVQLFCSRSCVMASKIQAVSAAGISLDCDNCGNNTIPACHLAMSDASIKNFCSLTCAMTFKETHKDKPAASDETRANNQTQCDFFKPPEKMPRAQSQHITKTTPKIVQPKEDTPAASNETRANIQTQCDFFKPSGKLLCAQCRHVMKTTPKVVQQKNKMDFVCSLACFQEFKRANKIPGKCEFCKSEQIIRKAKRVDGKDCYFCSERCKKLFHHQLVRQWGKHCSSCAYCQSSSRMLVMAKYEGNNEEFCSEECSAKFKMLVCHVAQCDACGHKGELKQRLPMLGEVKHFCNLKCLRDFCHNKVQTINTALVPNRPGSGYHPCWRNLESSPRRPSGVVESSLASSLARKTSTSSSTTHCGLIPDIQTKVFVHGSTQTVPKEMKNKSMICTPFVHNKGVSCTTQMVDTDTQTDNFVPKVIVVPLPVPVYIPLPIIMYSQYTQKSLGLPLPVPVPVVLPPVMSDLPEPTVKAMEEGVQLEPSEGKPNHRSEMEIEQDDEEEQEAGESTEGNSNKIRAMKDHAFSKDLGSLSSQQQSANPPLSTPSPPPAPQMTEPAPPLSTQTLDKAHNKNTLSPAAQEDMDQIDVSKVLSRKHHRLKSECGMEAWKRWIQWRESQTNQDPVSSHTVRLKEDILHYSAAELCDALCRFVNEVKQPDGEPYSPDNLFYLCLSLQQYLFDNSRLENIFSDLIYNKFSTEFTKTLKLPVTARGRIHSSVEEGFLWDCKQLGAYSPIVLLNTLLFFGCKYFGFTTVEQHRQLSFAHVICGTKTNRNSTKTTFLRFYPPSSTKDAEADTDGVPAKRCKKTQTKESFLEMTEDRENPLRCPVKLYKFYLSKCSDLVRQRRDLFYLCPDHHCVISSPLWFSFTPLDDSTLQDMLIRILTVRELQDDDAR